MHPSVPTFGHLDEAAVFRRIPVLHQIFFSLLCCAPLWARQQRARQEPEGDGRQQGDDPGYEVAQPPGPHPASVCRGDADAICRCNLQIHLNGIKQRCEVGGWGGVSWGKHVYD